VRVKAGALLPRTRTSSELTSAGGNCAVPGLPELARARVRMIWCAWASCRASLRVRRLCQPDQSVRQMHATINPKTSPLLFMLRPFSGGSELRRATVCWGEQRGTSWVLPLELESTTHRNDAACVFTPHPGPSRNRQNFYSFLRKLINSGLVQS
jgi:hypothetical protein